MARATYQLQIDWAGNGFSDVSNDDVTARTLDQRTPLTVKYGRSQARQFSPTDPGEMQFELNNISRDYSPENTSSPIAGLVTPGRQARLQATVGTTVTTLYTGYLDDLDIHPGLNDRSVPASCLDALGSFRGVTISTPLYQAIRTGDAIGYVLDAVGWPAAARDLDAGVSFLPFWWLDGADAFEALMELADSDGPASLITVDQFGRIVFRDRHHRLTRAASLTAQATWRSSGTEPVMSDPLTYNHGFKEIVNSVSVDVPLRTIDFLPSQVWSSQGLVTIAAGTTVYITAKASGAFLNAIVPVQDTDYTLVSGGVTMGLSQTSGANTIISILAASDSVVQDLSLRAQAVQSTSITVLVEDAVSIDKYGRKSLADGRLPVWANPYDALAILTLIVAKRAERLPTLQITMRGAGSAARLAECIGRNLSDRVRVTESLTGLDSDCYIEQIQHTIGQGGTEHVTSFGVEKIPPVVTGPFTFDLAGAGFDQGNFAGSGADNPATMFRLDTAGQGFDQGLFSY
jgi:hypothetical protein